MHYFDPKLFTLHLHYIILTRSKIKYLDLFLIWYVRSLRSFKTSKSYPNDIYFLFPIATLIINLKRHFKPIFVRINSKLNALSRFSIVGMVENLSLIHI